MRTESPFKSFDFIKKALKPFYKKYKPYKKYKTPTIEYFNSSQQTYFRVPNFTQPLVSWYMSSRTPHYEYQFQKYLFFYFVTDQYPFERIALYFTSFNQKYFSLKISLYSNINMGLGLKVLQNQDHLLVDKVLNSSLTHTFFIPLDRSSLEIQLKLNDQTQKFQLDLIPFI